MPANHLTGANEEERQTIFLVVVEQKAAEISGITQEIKYGS
jgi:hypothetical protein